MDMRKLTRFFITTILLAWTVSLGLSQTDSSELILTYEKYIEQVLYHHPVAQRADLKLVLAQAEMLGARGFLDPGLQSDFGQKSFDQKLYYREFQGNINIPTQMGIDIVGGYENTSGDFLNPANSTDEFGLWHLGVEVDLWQGLFVNERRTALDQAEVFQELATNERQIALNELAFDASLAYILWQQYENFNEVLLENEEIAKTYFENTREVFFNGEKTAMDTLEAFILYQDAIALTQKNQMSIIKAQLKLENYLWYDEQPIALQKGAKPENYQTELFDEAKLLNDLNLENHPIILAAINKISYLEVEQKLKQEKLKPKVKLKFNPLLATSQNGISPTYSVNDYKVGLDFSMPLFFRGEKADFQRGDIKIQETKLDLQTKRNELNNKIDNSYQQQLLLRQQLNLLEKNVDGYKLLLDGENTKFQFGESSVFLLNKRQEKYIDGQLKVVETYTKRHVEILKLLYFSNILIAQ